MKNFIMNDRIVLKKRKGEILKTGVKNSLYIQWDDGYRSWLYENDIVNIKLIK